MSAFALFVMIGGLLSAEEPEPRLEPEELIQRALAARDAAQEAVRCARGAGIFQKYSLVPAEDGTIRKASHVRASFEFAYDGNKDLVEVSFRKGVDVEPEWDSQVWLLDGHKFYCATFSKRIIRKGARGEIYEPLEGGFPHQFLPVTFHNLIRVVAFLDNLDAGLGKVGSMVCRWDSGLWVLRVESAMGRGAQEFFIDPSKDYHVVKFVMFDRDGNLYSRTEKQLANAGDLWYVKAITAHEPPGRFPDGRLRSGDYFHLELSEFRPLDDLPNDLFTLASLGLPEGADFWDMRYNPPRVYRAPIPMTDPDRLDELLSRMPQQRSDGTYIAPPASTRPDTPFERSTRVWPWILASCGAAAMLAGAVLARRRKKAPP